MPVPSASVETATFAGGCFWCTEAVFERLKGVRSVKSGYAGGRTTDPSYEDVSSGTTGHAEAIQITFDPSVISYEKLLAVFWKTHDPTQRDRQGPDVGPQYRSAIFTHTEQQKRIALTAKERLKKSGLSEKPIVTEIVPFTNFFPAEEYHQNFYEKNPEHRYCQLVIDPKIEKLMKEFKGEIKNSDE
ncbi:MAG: peptide-methionine (S)-S-oxide reductase [Parcubacteria group bacterium Gr01-1014_38]|nr:MAG: peptide-methionine (S)-S-oxide reductase [Parcubacteria group bacterium Gr01-1014_38]